MHIQNFQQNSVVHSMEKNTCFWASERNHQLGITHWDFSDNTLTGEPSSWYHKAGNELYII